MHLWLSENKEAHERLRKFAESADATSLTEIGGGGWRKNLMLSDIQDKERLVLESLEMAAQYSGLVSEMAFVYVVAAFDAFVSDLLRLVLSMRPEMLKSSERNVSPADVIEADSREALIELLAARRVRKLASFKELVSALKTDFGVDLDAAKEVSIESMAETQARRNLLLHNRGIVNVDYLRLTGATEVSIGDRLETDGQYVDRKCEELCHAARWITAVVSEKFLRHDSRD